MASGVTTSTVRVTQVFVTMNVADSITSLAKSGATTSFADGANGNLDTKTSGWDVDSNFENG